MKAKPKVIVVIFVSLILCFSTAAWGRSMVTGKVLDAQSGAPIEGAAFWQVAPYIKVG